MSQNIKPVAFLYNRKEKLEIEKKFLKSSTVYNNIDKHKTFMDKTRKTFCIICTLKITRQLRKIIEDWNKWGSQLCS